jgi:hypothetical protein
MWTFAVILALVLLYFDRRGRRCGHPSIFAPRSPPGGCRGGSEFDDSDRAAAARMRELQTS